MGRRGGYGVEKIWKGEGREEKGMGRREMRIMDQRLKFREKFLVRRK